MKESIELKRENYKYDKTEIIRIIGHNQIAAYWLNGVIPLEIYPDKDHKTGKPILIGVFKKEDTKDVFDKWVKHELN